jgi:hypothetical protein
MTAARPRSAGVIKSEQTGDRSKGAVEQVIDTLATNLGNSIGWLADKGVLFAVFAVIWIAFGVALVWSQGSLDQVWARIQDLPLIAKAVAWLLFLPVMLGLWAWETSWPLIVRLTLVFGIAGWNLLVFLPRAAETARP